MALITIPQLDRLAAPPIEKRARARTAAGQRILEEFGQELRKTAAEMRLLKEAQAPMHQEFDVFLSHSLRDAVRVLELKKLIERLGYSVYVDWVEDEELDRQSVSKKTAERLRKRIRRSRSLLVHATEHTSLSRWVPWEIGVADGAGKRVGVLPTPEADVDTSEYRGEEYLGLYPYIHLARIRGTDDQTLWANRNVKTYVDFDSWLDGHEPWRREKPVGRVAPLRG
ncbi:TIR domain-containing protein [Sorangium sp. So ce341]|uniref:TIR domain-containing protein n=1 Tax=Sorangium sp. So ce341 TaxID=3133302 RepID=UPI003F5E6F14